MTIKPPKRLRELKGWLIWKYEYVKGREKPLKTPYYASGVRRHGTNGSEADTEALVDYDTAVLASERHKATGVGFAPLPQFGIAALDFDKCVVDGVVDKEVEELVINTYAEFSPSGTGIRAFVEGNLGNCKSLSKNDSYGLELFSTKGYVTFTGSVIPVCSLVGTENTVMQPSEKLTKYLTNRFGNRFDEPNIENSTVEPLGLSTETITEALSIYKNNDCDYEEWLRVGMGLHHEFRGSEEGFILWDTWSANSEKYTSEEYNRLKWDSFGKTDSPTQITIKSLIKQANALGADISYSVLTDEDFPEIEETEDDISPPKKERAVSAPRFNIRPTAEFISDVRPISWLFKGFLPHATLGVLYGESGSGKSFIALDLCASLARGVAWNGLRPAKSPSRVLYVVAEGVGGFSHRLTAYCNQKRVRPSDLAIDIVSDVPPNLMDRNHVSQLIHEIGSQPEPYKMLVFDTFAQMTPGANENSGEDMGLALANCREISRSTDALVLLVHHSGKDTSRGVRGWSGVHAASDAIFEIKRSDNNGTIRVVKQKDGVIGTEFGFKLTPVPVGTDEDGDDITSCVVEYCQPTKEIRKMSDIQELILKTFDEYSLEGWVTEKNLIELCIDDLPKDDEGRDRRKDILKRSLSRMVGVTLEKNDNNQYKLKSE